MINRTVFVICFARAMQAAMEIATFTWLLFRFELEILTLRRDDDSAFLRSKPLHPVNSIRSSPFSVSIYNIEAIQCA
jgi:hypothetical protein